MNLSYNDIEKLFVCKSFFRSQNINIFEGISKTGIFILRKRTKNISLLQLPKDWIIKEE